MTPEVADKLWMGRLLLETDSPYNLPEMVF